MVQASRRKEYPLSMRLPQADIALIDRAASQQGRSRTDFVREAAVRAAEQALMENTLIRLSPGAFKDFMAIVSAPEAAMPGLVARLRRTAPWDKGSDGKGT